MTALKSPYPYFGGKSRIVDALWARFGKVDNLIIPFFGSGPELIRCPAALLPKIITVNDLNCFVANVWRAIQHDPIGVASHCDWPVNEADMHARHRFLMGVEAAEPTIPPEFDTDDLRPAYLAGFRGTSPSGYQAFRRRIRSEPEYFDSKLAGWWIWGQCCWIGSGWCTDSSLTVSGDIWQQIPELMNTKGVNGISQKLPDISGHAKGTGRGVHQISGPGQLSEKIPLLTSGFGHAPGTGVHGNQISLTEGRPQLADAFARGRGVHGHDAAETCRERREWLTDWMGRLSDRLRTVRVCSGDWSRVCSSNSVTVRLGMTAVHLDPPYSAETGRNMTLYGEESGTVAHDVRKWCLAWGPTPKMRISLCGLDGEHNELEAHGWTKLAWKSNGGYGNRQEGGNEKADLERIWFSPACIDPRKSGQRSLFDHLPVTQGV